jgi:hypothetical protein
MPTPINELRAQLKKIAKAEGGETFLDWPDRWWEAFLRRCENDHVSSMVLRKEIGGDVCLACGAQVAMTFPEDRDGPLQDPNDNTTTKEQ